MVATEKGEIMANPYFNYTNPLEPGDRLESNKYNNDFGAIAKAFDSLPSPEELATNTGNYAVSTGTSTAYQVTLPSFEGDFGYIEGMQVLMRAHVTNTGPATLSINGEAAIPIRNFHTGVGPTYALLANDMLQNAIYSLRYDGTFFQVVNSVNNALISSQTAAALATAAASNAATSEANALSYRNTAQAQVPVAAASASAAATSEANALSYRNAAQAAQAAALASEGNASTSATSAGNSATAASGSAATASASAGTATNANTQAQSAASSAATNALAAQNAATAAANSAAQAQAVLTDDGFKQGVLNAMYSTSLVVGTTKFYAANINPNSLFPGTTWQRLPADYSIRTAATDGSNVMSTGGSDNVTLVADNLPSHGHTASVTINSYTFPSVTTSNFNYGNIKSTDFGYDATTTAPYSFGTLTTDNNAAATQTSNAAGAHTHNVSVTTGTTPTASPVKIMGTTTPGAAALVSDMTTDGNHTHNVTFPAHSHTLTLPSHTHSLNYGLHSHQVTFPAHSHNVTVGNHSHTVTPVVNNAGNGASFSVRNKVLFLVGWRRTA